TTLIVAVVYILGVFFYADIAYDPEGVVVPNHFYPPLGMLATFLCVAVYRVVFEEGEARVIRGAMGKYLSPAVLEMVLRNPEQLKLGGEKRIMPMPFTDSRGFT